MNTIPISAIPVILAGGSGTRLWPMSRALYPKQFLKLGSDKSLLQNTANRAKQVCELEPIIVCNEQHRFLTAEQLREDGHNATILLEPCARNTAPAIALAALCADSDAILAVMAADHIVEDVSMFSQPVSYTHLTLPTICSV